MALVELDTVGNLGLIKDLKSYTLDPVAWNEALNVRFVDGEVHTIGGRRHIFGTLPQAPQFIIPVATNVQVFWLWMSATDGFVYDGTNHTEVTRAAGGDYASPGPEAWNGVLFGGIPIVNNGVDIPQFWATVSAGTDLANLTNWPTIDRAKVIRALGPYLVAINITRSGSVFPHRVKWSHAADPGALPASWDHTDPTVDAGESELPDVQAGVLLDALNLRGQLFLYKESSVWRMRFVGGQFVFAFDTFLDTVGLLAPRCVGVTGDGQRHFVVTQDEVILHDGNSVDSIFDKKFNKHLFRRIDPDNYYKSFVYTDPTNKEMHFCYPTQGSAVVNRGLIWNYKTGTISEMEVDYVAAAQGPVEESPDVTWDTVVGTWDEQVGPWAEITRRSLVVAKNSNSRFLMLESGNLFDGAEIATVLQRTGLAIVGQKRDRTPIVNFNARKMATRIYPRMEGGPIQVRFGAQDQLDGPVRWTSKQTFNPTSQTWIDEIVEGAALAIEFSSETSEIWKLEGYKLEVSMTGEY